MKISISYPPIETSKNMDVDFRNLSKEQKIALGEILGTIASDGYFGLTSQGLYNYILCVKDKNFVEYIAQDFLKLGIKTAIHRRQSGLWYIEVSRRWFDKLLVYLEKENRYWLFTSKVIKSQDRDFQSAVIRSFADADGTATCTIKNGEYYSRRIAIYNKSKNLLSQLQLMLKNFGINSYIKMDRKARIANIKKQIVKFPTVYSLRITNYRNLKIFYQEINFKIKRKVKKLIDMITSYQYIGREYTKKDYWQVLSLYKKYPNCREVSRKTDIPPQTVQNWILLGKKPRILKIINTL